MNAKAKWDRIHGKADASVVPAACHVLKTYGHILPQRGTALDLACGLGGNALFLADHGLNTRAVDISSVAIEQLHNRHHSLITTQCVSIGCDTLDGSVFDVIVVSNYLDRSICTAIAGALKPGGILFYQTFVENKSHPDVGPKNKEFLLGSNELLSLFKGLGILVFSDESTEGDINEGFRNQSFLVAVKS